MKFGKVLTQSIELSSSEYERSWVNYKQLKRIIKDCAQIPKHDKLKKEKLIEAAKQNSDNESIRTHLHTPSSPIMASCAPPS